MLQQELADGRKSCGSARPLTTAAHHWHPPLHPTGAAAWAVPPQKTVLSAAPGELLGMKSIEPLACVWLSRTEEQLTHSRHVERLQLWECCKFSRSLLRCEVNDHSGCPRHWLWLLQQACNEGPQLPPAPQGWHKHSQAMQVCFLRAADSWLRSTTWPSLHWDSALSWQGQAVPLPCYE